MTWIFLSPALSRMTSNSSCSASAGAASPPPPAAGAAATATGAAAVTPKVSSNCFTNSDSSSSVISLNASSRSSVLIFAMVGGPLFLLGRRVAVGRCGLGGGGVPGLGLLLLQGGGEPRDLRQRGLEQPG